MGRSVQPEVDGRQRLGIPGTPVSRLLRLAHFGLAAAALAVAVASWRESILFRVYLVPAAFIQCASLAAMELVTLPTRWTPQPAFKFKIFVTQMLDSLGVVVALALAYGGPAISRVILQPHICAQHREYCDSFRSSAPKAFALWIALQAPSLALLVYDIVLCVHYSKLPTAV